jgi:hypothetical protein
MTAAGPVVVVIDDEPRAPDRRLVNKLNERGVASQLRHPSDVTVDDLRNAAVVAIDEYLDSRWPERDAAPVTMRPIDGIAVAAILRGHFDQGELGDLREGRPAAFVIRTANLDRLAGELPRNASQHLIAAHHGVDWVQAKGDEHGQTTEDDRLAQLADAVHSLPQEWTNPDATLSNEVFGWLGLRDQDWFGAAQRQVEDCRPVSHRLAQQTRGTSFLRWFLHGVLPYPSFLIGEVRAAASLGLTTASFRKVIGTDSALSNDLDAVRYVGALATFHGRRWWRAGLNALAWRLTDGHPADGDVLAKRLRSRHGERIQTLGTAQRFVVVLDDKYRPAVRPVPIDAAVRIRPDDWPSYADEAWAAIDDVEDNPDLRAMVLSTDRPRLRED